MDFSQHVLALNPTHVIDGAILDVSCGQTTG